MVSKKQRKKVEEMAQIESDIGDGSEASMDRDMEVNKVLYSSEDMPTDIYRYKRMRLVPNSEAEFPGLVDKDVVLANVKDKKPDPDYLRFISETIVALDVFSKRILVNKYDAQGKLVMTKVDGRLVPYREVVTIPDPDFDVIREFLRSSYKADLTLSRAMGKDREAVLDRTQNFGKEIKKTQGANKYG